MTTNEEMGLGIFAIVLAIIIIGVIVGLIAYQNSTGEDMVDSHLKDYSSFTANGIDYKSDDVSEYEYIPNGYENDAIVFKMENGDEVHILIDTITWHK